MYSKKFNYFHGIMFHHFHDNKLHKKGQGSLNKKNLLKIINFIGRKNILDADVFYQKLLDKKLKRNEVCFTFDDGIKCQFDIALPVLNDLKIKSFFFVYSNLFTGKPDYLEVFRYFRTNYFKSINKFYKLFFTFVKDDLNIFFKKNSNEIKLKKIKFPHYSLNDIKFRMVRDTLLTKREYKSIMFKMFKIKNFNPKKYFKNLFMSKNDLKKINLQGHIVGLHSHSHPTLLENLTFKNQLKEYENNQKILSKILKKKTSYFKTMSHPCGSYNEDTKKILNKLGVKLGFKQIMTLEKEKKMKKINNSNLEIARQDHSDIISIINK